MGDLAEGEVYVQFIEDEKHLAIERAGGTFSRQLG
jgi:hypothetical protein